jgi:integrase
MKEQERTLKNQKSGGEMPMLRHFSKTDIRYWDQVLFHDGFTRDGKRREVPDWSVRIQHKGKREAFPLRTANRAAAAAKARDIYLCLVANGWAVTLERFKPKPSAEEEPIKTNCTVGEFLSEIKAKADGDPRTIEGYCKMFRKIVADISGIEGDTKRFDYRTGGYQEWLGRVHSVKLDAITPDKVQQWKRGFLSKAGSNAMALRKSRVSVNSLMRQAKSLFSPKITKHLQIQLPTPLPFSGIEFEPRQSLKYRSIFDIEDLIQKANKELPQKHSEPYKIFLLAVAVGLRRKEIDLLEWDAFQWDSGLIRVEPTQYFHPKSEDSIGEIQVDTELLAIFRGYKARALGCFVIESIPAPKPDVIYYHYRCQRHFEFLTEWLRKKGVRTHKPLHTLRKEFGSLINRAHGIHAASCALRHADIRVTNEYYTDSRARATAGIGHLLKPANVTPIPGQNKPDREARHGRIA